ncbi:MAG: cell wall-binding repeat-containing protein [Actinomycetota bacterium]|nr:cell wall-binding repeat-containing protein [Actinomycetota bacterium]
MLRRLAGLIALTLAALVMGVAPAPAQTPPTNETALAADAFGVEVTVDPLSIDLLQVGPLPSVRTYQPPATDPVTESVAQVGPVPDPDGGLIEYVRAVTVTAGGDLAAERATATAETAAASLLGELVTADALKAVSTTTCEDPPATAEEAAARAAEGSRIVNLTVGDTVIPVTPEPNQVRIQIPGVADVRVLEVLPDVDGNGWTTRALHIFTLDPVTGLVNGEIIVAEAHSSVACAAGDVGPPPGADDNPILITKDATPSQALPGDEVTYDITVTNRSEQPCTVFEVIDRLPPGFGFVQAGGDLTGIDPSVDGSVLRFRNPQGFPLAPGETFDATITVRLPLDLAAGTYFDDAEARTSCGSARTGLTGPVTVPQDRVPRVGGDDRVDTGTDVARDVFESATAAVLARSEEFPDALASSTLAVEVDGPLLITPSRQLDPRVADELRRLGVETVYLSGGQVALSQAIEDELVASGYEVIRLDGEHRYDTAALIAEEVVRLGGEVQQAIVARADIFPDALAASNLATYGRAPILLSDPDNLPERTRQVLRDVLAGNRLWIAGGPEAVQPGPEGELRDEGYDVDRLAGSNRYGTAVAIVTETRRQGADVEPTLVASGLNFPDALVAGVAAFKLGGVLILVDPGSVTHSPATVEFLEANRQEIDTAIIVGGTAAISQNVQDEILELIRDRA